MELHIVANDSSKYVHQLKTLVAAHPLVVAVYLFVVAAPLVVAVYLFALAVYLVVVADDDLVFVVISHPVVVPAHPVVIVPLPAFPI